LLYFTSDKLWNLSALCLIGNGKPLHKFNKFVVTFETQ
jgi:hypothetical protein